MHSYILYCSVFILRSDQIDQTSFCQRGNSVNLTIRMKKMSEDGRVRFFREKFPRAGMM